MKFINYCVVAITNIDGISIEIDSISDIRANYLTPKENNYLIATFTSIMTISEIIEFFKDNKRNVIIFELNKKTSSFNFNENEIYNSLFDFLKYMTEEKLENRTTEFVSIAAKDAENMEFKIMTDDEELNKYDVDNITSENRNLIINSILDKGVANMSEYDKSLLAYLTNIL